MFIPAILLHNPRERQLLESESQIFDHLAEDSDISFYGVCELLRRTAHYLDARL